MKPIMDEIKQKSKPDFLALCTDDSEAEASSDLVATNRFSFGDRLIYTSPQNPELKTRCAFIRDDSGKAVVMFINAEWAARVNYCNLSKEDY